jgi:hypothetical protein
MGQTVQSLVQEFSHDAFAVSRALRDLRDANPDSFEWAALCSLSEMEDCPGTRYLVTLLQEEDSLLRRITNPHLLSLHQAIRLIQALRHSDPQTEIRLLRLIMPGAAPVPDEVVERVLDLIDAVTDGPKLVPVLMQLYRSAPKRVRARLATTIGRHHRNREWVDERLRDEDSRVRANMVEVFWGEKTQEAIDVFHLGWHDPDSRVKANGAIGLYRCGAIESLAMLANMAASESAQDRASAAWAFGMVRDPRFQKTLAQFVKDPDPIVRRRAYHSLGEIKRRNDQWKVRQPCQLRFIKLHRASEGLLHILFEAKVLETQSPVKGIKPLEILVTENSTPVLDYHLVERVKYPQPGVYDLHFHSEYAKTPEPGVDLSKRMLKVEVAVSTETKMGELSSYWFGD